MEPVLNFNYGASFWIVICSYGLLLAGISVYFVRYVRNTDDFFLASGHTPWLMSGLSFIMTAFSAGVFVANASLAYNHGGVNLFLIGTQLSIFVCGYFIFSRRWHRCRVKTAIEFIEKRYSRSTAKFFVWTGVPMRILDNANRLYVTGVIIETMFGVSLGTAIAFTVVVTLVYTIFGGYIAIVVTDVLQAIALGVIVMIMSIIAFVRVGGIEGFMSRLPEGYWSLNPENSNWGFLFVVAWMFVGIFAWNGNWSLVQRYLSVERESDAKKVSIVGGLCYLLLFVLLALPPMFAAALIPGLEGTQGAEQSYIRLAQMLLPAGLLGLMFFAIFGATVTALNSELNVMGQVVVQDMLKKVLNGWTEKRRLLLSRVLIVFIMLGCAFIALGIRAFFGGSLNYLLTILGLTTLPTFIPMLLGLVYRKTPSWGCVLAFALGLGISVVLTFGFKVYVPYVIFINGIVTTAVMFITGEVWGVRGERAKAVAALFERLTTPGSGDPEEPSHSSFKGVMLPIINISLLVMGCVLLLTAFLSQSGSETRLIELCGAGGFFFFAAILHLARARLVTQ